MMEATGSTNKPMHIIERGTEGASLRSMEGGLVGTVVGHYSASQTVFSSRWSPPGVYTPKCG